MTTQRDSRRVVADKLPQSLEAERSVLGAILLDQAAILKVLPILREVDFFVPSNREIFRAMQELQGMGQVIDPVILVQALSDSGRLNNAGGAAYGSPTESTLPTCLLMRRNPKPKPMPISMSEIDAKDGQSGLISPKYFKVERKPNAGREIAGAGKKNPNANGKRRRWIKRLTGEELFRARSVLRMSQFHFAIRVGVSQSAVSQAERGITRFNAIHAWSVSTLLRAHKRHMNRINRAKGKAAQN